MVLSVARRVLGQEQDAEDVCQATFLLLARKASQVLRTHSVAGWLCSTARLTALNARKIKGRRTRAAIRAGTRATKAIHPSLEQMTGAELVSALDEELARLPDRYRSPLVLCCMEGLARDAAARRLGVPLGTFRMHLERGRRRLQAALARRGIELGIALLAVGVGQNASAARAESVRSIMAVIRGTVPAGVAALSQGVTTMKTMKFFLFAFFAACTTAVAAVALGIGRFPASEGPATANEPSSPGRTLGPAATPAATPAESARPALGQVQPSPQVAESETVAVRGRVLDPGGKPVCGAKVYLARATDDFFSGATSIEPATSGPDGRFEFPISRSELERDRGARWVAPTQVMAVAQGFGCDWTNLGSAEGEITFRLVPDVPVKGRILDPDGRPVAGARISVLAIGTVPGDNLDNLITRYRQGLVINSPFVKRWNGPLPRPSAVLTTGADGHFHLAGVGRERCAELYVEGPGIATAALLFWNGCVLTRPMEKMTFHREGVDMTQVLYGSSFDYVGAPTRPIRGVVRDKASGKPLAGVAVENRPEYDLWARCKAVTDKEGRYELRGMRKSNSYTLVLTPPDGLTFQRRVQLTDTPGLGVLNGDVEMLRGLTLRGTVTDKATGKPVPQARVEYYPLFGNPNVPAAGVAGEWAPCSLATTEADGTYVLTAFPGPGVIAVADPNKGAYRHAVVTKQEVKDFFKTPVHSTYAEGFLTTVTGTNNTWAIRQEDYHALGLAEPGEKDEGLVKDIALERPRTVAGRVVGPDGQPVSGAAVFGLVLGGQEALKGSEFTVRGLNPRDSRSLILYHAGKKLGFFLSELCGDTAGPVTVKLQPCGSVSGRVVDKEGKPQAGARVEYMGSAGLANGTKLESVTTDKEGRFRVEGLVPGLPYVLFPADPPPINVAPLKSGEQKDLGDLVR
jgi:RNA polymerase sigma factor (sigma-70 family)